MANSYLISSISSALNHLDLIHKKVSSRANLAKLELRIDLRNLQMQLVICSRKLGDDLPSRIEAAIAKILLRETPLGFGYDDWILRELHRIAKQLVADECSTSPLAVDDVLAVADSILKNVADFLVPVSTTRWSRTSRHQLKVDIIQVFVAQVTFLKSLLVLAKGCGAGAQLQHLMIHFQPFAINAARVFIADGTEVNWHQEVNIKCSAAIGLATSPQVYEAYTRALSACTLSSTPAPTLVNFLDSLISLLWNLLRSISDSRVKDQLKLLYERLRFWRSILKRKSGGFGGVMIRDAGIMICLLNHKHVEISYPDRLSELLQGFAALQARYDAESTAPTTNELGSGDSAYIREDITDSGGSEEAATSGNQPQRSNSAPRVAAFQDDEVNAVLGRLTRGSKQLQIVPICGMPGLGKTTFASALYNHRSVIYHFHSRAWCPVSQVLDRKRVMLHLLNQLLPESGSYLEMTENDLENKQASPESASYSEMTENDLENKLRQSLKGKRYLIVLDDVWTTQAWHSLALSFPDDSTRSRIILTSRRRDIVHNQQPHLLRLRDDTECLEILMMTLSHKKGWTSEFGMTVAKMCKGLPLTAVVLAGLLGTTKQQGWRGILDHLSVSGLSGEKQCNNVLELSFNHLSNDLKLCFLYFSAFPEDEEIYLKRLLRLWIAEGFIRESEPKRIEDVAREYMENLIQRSLVVVAQNRSIGGVKTCRIHDLIHNFCVRKVKQDNLFHVLSQRDDELSDFNEPPNLQRLSIHSLPLHFKEAKLFCPRAHSILFFSTSSDLYLIDMLFIVQIFKLLTVLDMQSIPLSTGIPSEIELLTRLRYLSIRSDLAFIPSSLGNLPNLETLLLEFWPSEVVGFISFPHTFWNMHKLKWLSIFPHGFTLPTEDLENRCALLELETLSGVFFNSYDSMEQQMRKLPNIRRLKCVIKTSTTHFNKIVVPDFLHELECLTIIGNGRLQCGFGWSENLRRLSLFGFELSREEIADIGKLPNLEVLKMRSIRFWGDTLDMKEEEFSNLRYLKMVNIRIKRWTVSDEQLPCLKKLSMFRCEVSEELPSDCLATSATLEEIVVYSCPPNLEDFAREIQLAQEDYGNLVKVHIRTRILFTTDLNIFQLSSVQYI